MSCSRRNTGSAPTDPPPSRPPSPPSSPFLLIGSIPLAAYIVDLVEPGILGNPFLPACALTAVAFFAVGAFKSRFVDQHWAVGGGETLGVGALAAVIAYGIGVLLRPLAEGL